MEAQPLTRYIHIDVDNEYVRGAGVMIGAVGSHNDVILEIEFSEMWTGADSITFLWLDANGENPKFVLDDAVVQEDGKYYVPVVPEAKTVPGKATLAIKGVVNNTTDPTVEARATLAVAAKFIVMDSEWDSDAEESQAPDATVTEQLQAAINSKVSQTYVDAALATKQDTLTFDDEPDETSSNPVKSSGIYNAIAETSGTLHGLIDEKQDILSVDAGNLDDTPDQDSSNPITSRGVAIALSEKIDWSDVEIAVRDGSSKPVSSNAVHDALETLDNAKQNKLVLGTNFDATPQINSENPVASGGVYNALANKQDVLNVNNHNIDAVPYEGSQNPVTSNGVFVADKNLQDQINVLKDLGLTADEYGRICLTYTSN